MLYKLKKLKDNWPSILFISFGFIAIVLFGYYGGKGLTEDIIVFEGEDTIKYWALFICILWSDIFMYFNIYKYKKMYYSLREEIYKVKIKEEKDVENTQRYSMRTRDIVLSHILEEKD